MRNIVGGESLRRGEAIVDDGTTRRCYAHHSLQEANSSLCVCVCVWVCVCVCACTFWKHALHLSNVTKQIGLIMLGRAVQDKRDGILEVLHHMCSWFKLLVPIMLTKDWAGIFASDRLDLDSGALVDTWCSCCMRQYFAPVFDSSDALC